jgi:hypothetical protein
MVRMSIEVENITGNILSLQQKIKYFSVIRVVKVTDFSGLEVNGAGWHLRKTLQETIIH